MMAIFMPTDFKSLSINNLLKLQYPSHVLTNENIFKPYFNIGAVESANVVANNNSNNNNNTNSTMMMTELSDQNNSKIRLCSEDDSNSNDSDLSVGQEKVVNNNEQNISNNNNNNNNNNVNIKEPVNSDVDDEEMSNASSSQYTNSSTRLCSPQNSNEIMRPIFHEEILRNSQLYAEEILRQRIAAAARLQSVTESKNHLNSLDEPEPSIISKYSFQTGMFSAASKPLQQHNSENNNHSNNENGNNLFCAKSAINFQNIHSHLSAISQITQNLGSSNIKKDDATSLSSLSRESSQSPSGFQQYKHHHHHHHHHQQKHGFHTSSSTHQNQLHEHNLKFSIDNILKADFGRRITEPLLLKTSRLKRNMRGGEGKHEKEKINKFEALQKEQPHNSSVMTKDKSLDQTFTSSTETTSTKSGGGGDAGTSNASGSSSSSSTVWPAWVFCTRYSDRPSSGRSPRVKKPKKPPSTDSSSAAKVDDEKRPRTAFSGAQLARLKHEFNENRYLTEKRRQQLSSELGLNEAQIKIWFQNKRAKIKKSSGQKNPLALQLMAQGLYNHSTVPLSKEEEEMQELQSSSGN